MGLVFSIQIKYFSYPTDKSKVPNLFYEVLIPTYINLVFILTFRGSWWYFRACTVAFSLGQLRKQGIWTHNRGKGFSNGNASGSFQSKVRIFTIPWIGFQPDGVPGVPQRHSVTRGTSTLTQPKPNLNVTYAQSPTGYQKRTARILRATHFYDLLM